jgi:hypothetical protein
MAGARLLSDGLVLHVSFSGIRCGSVDLVQLGHVSVWLECVWLQGASKAFEGTPMSKLADGPPIRTVRSARSDVRT